MRDKSLRSWAGLPGICLAILSATGSWPAQAETSADHLLGALLDGSGFVQIPAGEFQMGSGDGNPDERPERKIRITKPFFLGKYEVTQAQWDAVMRDPHVRPRDAGPEPDVNPSKFRGPSQPVESVSWDSVHEFLRRLNQRDVKFAYRLPTEAEWEYAARKGNPKSLDLNRSAWCEPTSGGQTHPAGSKTPDSLGLFDMLGNVQEWVEDWYSPAYGEGAPENPTGPSTGSYKVYRGGAWLSSGKQCRAGYRGFDFPNNGYYSVGFRLVRTPR